MTESGHKWVPSTVSMKHPYTDWGVKYTFETSIVQFLSEILKIQLVCRKQVFLVMILPWRWSAPNQLQVDVGSLCAALLPRVLWYLTEMYVIHPFSICSLCFDLCWEVLLQVNLLFCGSLPNKYLPIAGRCSCYFWTKLFQKSRFGCFSWWKIHISWDIHCRCQSMGSTIQIWLI